MRNTRFPRGSEWRRWDLQVHTPYSALNNGYGSDFDNYAKTLLLQAIEKRIAAIGITDYFSVEGYRQLREIVGDAKRLEKLVGGESAQAAQGILLLPNIEFRTSVIIRDQGGKDSRVNFHVVFTDDLDPKEIEESFLRELRFTAQAGPGKPDEEWSLTIKNLEALGKLLKSQHVPFRSQSDLHVGMTNAVIVHEEVTKVLERQASRFRDRYLMALPSDEDLSKCSWDGQGHLARKLLVQKAHMLFSPNRATREFGLGRKHPSVQSFIDEFSGLKPCVHGSDAHNYDALFEPAAKRYLWVKADVSFLGLRQLLHEPEARIHIGEVPAELLRVKGNATKYLHGVGFDRTPAAQEGENWFSGEIPLNHGLIAIIGKKGSGKSALADILALLGNAHTPAADLSFLRPDRFLNPKTKLGAMFRAKIDWHSALSVARRLNETSDPTAPELMKYIPQSYLETICSDFQETSHHQFQHELMEVIFSHVDEADRLGQETLPELVNYLTEESEARISQLSSELADRNRSIVALEERGTEEHRKTLQESLAQKRAELKAHDGAKPAPVNEPAQDPEAQKRAALVGVALEKLKSKEAKLAEELAAAQGRLRKSALEVAACDRLAKRIENLERYLDNFFNESAQDGTVLGLDVRSLVVLSLDRKPIVGAKGRAQEANRAAKVALATDVEGSIAAQRVALAAEMDSKRLELDEPNRRHQLYIQQLADWQKRRNEIEGTAKRPNSVKGLEAKAAALSEVPGLLALEKQERGKLVREIFAAKRDLLDAYRRLYAPVQDFIDRHPASKGPGALEFTATMVDDGLVERLLDMLHQGKRGSFQGEQEGRERLRLLLALSDFSSETGVQDFLDDVQDNLENDKRDGSKKPVRLKDQLRHEVSPEDVYDFLHGLEYLTPRFELRWQGKSLDQLSPGERGTLLLVFYLLIDKRDVPLILDQPEENLDNETIATVLVPAIKDAKERRQVIMVTHNPNLAVVCDADQIIHCRLDKTDGNRVSYTSGALENPAIAQMIIDVLEGTKPAFDLRDAKYGILEQSR